MTVTASELSAIVEPLVSAALTTAAAQAREDGRQEGLREAAEALKADAEKCDCHAYEEGECACGAWCNWKSITSARAVEIVLALTTKATPDAD